MHRGITLSPTDAAYITGFADRTATNPTVAAYARQMRDGDWRDGSLLRFGYIEGEIRLGDGSHRLRAQVLAARPLAYDLLFAPPLWRLRRGKIVIVPDLHRRRPSARV